MFYTTSALGTSWQHLYHPNFLPRSVYSFHVNFHVKTMLGHLGISLSHKNGFSKAKKSCIKKAYYSICDNHGVTADEMWINGNWF